MSFDEQAFERFLKTAPVFFLNRMRKRFYTYPTTVDALWKEANPTIHDFINLRIAMLTEAGWDAAGWSVMEWSRLPQKLQQDLTRIWPLYAPLIAAESTAMLKRIEQEIQERVKSGNS